MYNGIGLPTPRGTGTSGHVTRHAAYIPTSRVERKQGRDILYNSKRNSNRAGAHPMKKKANKEILDHEKRREIEVAVAEMEEALLERGYEDEEIQEKVKELRAQLEKELLGKDDADPSHKKGKLNEADVHKIANRKERELTKFRNAFKVREDYQEGAGFLKTIEKKGDKKQDEPVLNVEEEKEKSPKGSLSSSKSSALSPSNSSPKLSSSSYPSSQLSSSSSPEPSPTRANANDQEPDSKSGIQLDRSPSLSPSRSPSRSLSRSPDSRSRSKSPTASLSRSRSRLPSAAWNSAGEIADNDSQTHPSSPISAIPNKTTGAENVLGDAHVKSPRPHSPGSPSHSSQLDSKSSVHSHPSDAQPQQQPSPTTRSKSFSSSSSSYRIDRDRGQKRGRKKLGENASKRSLSSSRSHSYSHSRSSSPSPFRSLSPPRSRSRSSSSSSSYRIDRDRKRYRKDKDSEDQPRYRNARRNNSPRYPRNRFSQKRDDRGSRGHVRYSRHESRYRRDQDHDYDRDVHEGRDRARK